MSQDYVFDDDDGGYDAGGMAEQQSEDYRVEIPRSKFFALSGDDIIKKYIDPMAAKLAGPLAISRPTAIFLLAAHKWNDDRVMSAYFEDDARACKAANVTICPADAPGFTKKAEKSYACKVCQDTEEETMPGGCLACGHSICAECWLGAVAHRAANSGEDAWFLTCLQAGCRMPAAPVFEEAAVVPPPLAAKLRDRLARAFAKANDHMVAHCSTATCDMFIYCGPSRRTLPPGDAGNMVRCSGCGGSTCCRCERENHLPATCDNMEAWDSKELADSANANWILANTHQCPKCHTHIQKNGGCNHHTCSRCRHEYCVVCMQDWTSHKDFYSCNRPKAADDKKSQAQNDLDLYLHYYKRFRVHQQSKALDGITVTKARAKVEAMVRTGQARLHDAEFWETTARTLVACRHTLMYSYIYAYYLPRTTAKEKNTLDLFEYQQGMLERAAEELSESVNASVADAPESSEVVGRTSIAKQMLEGLESGITQAKNG
jgi:hypothetical protein